MSLIIVSETLKQLPKIAKDILEYSLPNKKFLFYGEMGVGKTTLIKELSLQLGVVDVVSSPTFSIVNEYVNLSDSKIYHFDFYRLKDEQEAFDIGYEEYFLGDDYCFVEWPEKIPNLIEDDMVKIKIQLDGQNRVIEIII
ncbi:MAG: tRNA (adenosine(37)-N6)-threonylcarbamoyltransferase complex ATPase subunit type 1 TsaE [Bacteroidota bacterium]|nr:tRNA (adenosine(37)-N6)-threonylcarbamoyltransferase complex ATPase subunit type 1 TsaE [Bacteroidota bacterium]|tara:strand:- start:1820 stop:2239 length:420 start_codon:yes stop_codon:yes gene_type:complete